MKRLVVAIPFLMFCAVAAVAQKGTAEPDYYPLGYPGDTWTGKVTAVDNDARTLTLTHASGKTVLTFVASIPDAPYQRGHDGHNFRVIDFPYDKHAKGQTFRYVGTPGLTYIPPGESVPGIQHRPNPPASNVITDFTDFIGRVITVYYKTPERMVGGKKEKYNDVWRIRILPAK